MALNRDWPNDVGILLLIAAAGGGVAFGASGAVLPVVGGLVFGIAWFVRLTPSTNPATGDNEAVIVVFVVVAATVTLCIAAFVGACARWLFGAARRGAGK